MASFLELDFSPERVSGVKKHDDDAEDDRGRAPFGHHNPRTDGSQLVLSDSTRLGFFWWRFRVFFKNPTSTTSGRLIHSPIIDCFGTCLPNNLAWFRQEKKTMPNFFLNYYKWKCLNLYTRVNQPMPEHIMAQRSLKFRGWVAWILCQNENDSPNMGTPLAIYSI